MPRILLLIVLVWLLYMVGKRFIAKVQTKKPNHENTSAEEKIVACSQCGIHIPENESQLIGDEVICNNPNCNKQAK